MKLLKKEDIAEHLALDRKIEIDEGKKLATKVDALRIAYAQEEQRLRLFRDSTLQNIQREIDPWLTIKAELEAEINALTEAKKALQEPLDAKWKEVRYLETSLESLQEYLTSSQAGLLNLERRLREREQSIETEKSRIDDLKKSIESIQSEAAQDRQDAARTLQDALHEAQERESKIVSREQNLAHREANILSQEKDHANRYKALDARERTLNARETLIKDRFDTLLRTEKELKKRK